MNIQGRYCWVILLIASLTAYSFEITEKDKERTRDLVAQMTLEEKISYLSGETDFSLRPIERLGIPRVLLADGPQGIRNHSPHSTLYPCGVAAAATWNRNLIHRYGENLGEDARARGVGILLGPGVNIYRYPLCGRNFEYMGEDPYLASEMACSYIEGVQSKDVIATIKHFAGNNQEWNRHHASSDIDERTLHEIYFPTFRKAVMKARVGAVMNSYNLLNGVHATENYWLNTSILRDLWGFDGILMSDWVSVYSTVNAANSGLDLEMPKAEFFTDSLLKAALANGRISPQTIDRKVEHILQTLSAAGLLDGERSAEQPPLERESAKATALDVALEGLVLLKNTGSILPLKGMTAILGMNVDTIVSGGGSGAVFPYSFVSPAQAMRSDDDVVVLDYEGLFSPPSGTFYADEALLTPGFTGSYYDNKDFSATPVLVRVDAEIEFNYGGGAPAQSLPVDNFSIEWKGFYQADKDEVLRIAVGGDDGYRLSVNDSVLAEHWGQHAYDRRVIALPVRGGELYDFKLEYFDAAGDARVDIDVKSLNGKKLREILGRVDNIVLFTGFTSELESEGFDREYGLPQYEEAFIRQLATMNPNLTVVLNAGGAVDITPWIDSVKGLLMAWYPGQEGGTAIAEILKGKVSPSGKLPFSWYGALEDSPVYDNYYANDKTMNDKGPQECDHIEYREGIFMGYRGSDLSDKKPLYPFGFGLSYTEFDFSDLEVTQIGENEVEVSFTVSNTGMVYAAEVAQVYVGDPECSVPRPIKELKAFEKVFLKPGESRKVRIVLDEEAFSFYDPDNHKFKIEPGDFEIYVGNSSIDLPLKGTVRL